MLEALNGYDWEEAFKYAGSGNVTGVLGCRAPNAAAPFTRDEVVQIAGIREGVPDEAEWQLAGRLRDGRWFYLEAGCDYTGWG